MLAQQFRTRAGVFAALAAVLLSTTTALAHDPEQHVRQTRAPAWSKQLEARFLETMMDHHARTARLGKLARERSARAELRAWGDTLAVAHAAGSKRIDGLLRQGYERSHVSAAVSATEPLAKLKGAAFDQEFLRVMIQNHGAALAEAKDCRSLSTDARLTTLCGGLVDSHQREIVTMGSWLCQWYRKCD